LLLSAGAIGHCWHAQPAAIDRYLLQQQTRRTPLLLRIDGTDRQTDGETPDRYIDPAQHTTRGATISDRAQDFDEINSDDMTMIKIVPS